MIVMESMAEFSSSHLIEPRTREVTIHNPCQSSTVLVDVPLSGTFHYRQHQSYLVYVSGFSPMETQLFSTYLKLQALKSPAKEDHCCQFDSQRDMERNGNSCVIIIFNLAIKLFIEN